MKKTIWLVLGLTVFLGAGLAFGFLYVQNLKSIPSEVEAEGKVALSQEEVASIAKPAVVRIVQHVKGRAILGKFGFDFKTLSINPDPKGETVEIPFDEYITGSGFVVNENGYILTNSHVVSYQTIKLQIAAQHALEILSAEIEKAIEKKEKIPEEILNNEEAGAELGKKILDHVMTGGQFEMEKSLFVLDSNSQESSIDTLAEQGFEAVVVSVNDGFFDDDKDVALLKIEQSNLPTIKLGDASKVAVGSKVHVFGFPASAEFNGQNLLESSFTSGSINAFKDSTGKDFKIFQTDAKISHGSSGGPLLSGQGESVGIITFQANEFQREEGDNFAFALPVDIISDILAAHHVGEVAIPSILGTSDYPDHFMKGLRQANANHCKKAIEEFTAASQVNQKFSVERYTNPQIEKCEAKISAGESIDTKWDEKRQWLKNIGYVSWLFFGVALLILLSAIGVIVFLLMRLRRDEDEMHHLEEQIAHDHEEELSKRLPMKAPVSPPPAVMDKHKELMVKPEMSLAKVQEKKPVITNYP